MMPGMIDPRRRQEMEQWANEEDSFLPPQEALGPPPDMSPPGRSALMPPGPPPEYDGLPSGPSIGPPRGGIATPPFPPERPSFSMPPQAQPQGLQPPSESSEDAIARARLNILLANPPREQKPSLLGRIGSAAAGAGAGYLAARHVPYDAEGVSRFQSEMAHPGFAGQQRDWQQAVQGAQAQVGMNRQQQLDQSKMQHEAATSEEARKRGAWYDARPGVEQEKNTVEVTPEMVEQYGEFGLSDSKIGQRITWHEFEGYRKNASFKSLNASKEQIAAANRELTKERDELKATLARELAGKKADSGEKVAETRSKGQVEAARIRGGATTGAAQIGADQRNKQTVQDSEGNFVVVDKGTVTAKPTGVKGAPKTSSATSAQQLMDALRNRGKGGPAAAPAAKDTTPPEVINRVLQAYPAMAYTPDGTFQRKTDGKKFRVQGNKLVAIE